MNFLMLRGQVPQDRDPQEIVFDTLEEVDDMWTHLFYGMVKDFEHAELWYWGGERYKKFKYNLIERWVPSFKHYHNDSFIPDVIFCRGGFPDYQAVLRRFPKAIKIYYGAGRRFVPQDSFFNYDLILTDSVAQRDKAQEIFPKTEVSLFFKPAPDNLFYPIEGIEKEYDIAYPADGRSLRKGHDLVYSTVPEELKLLNLGFPSEVFNSPDNVESYRVIRSELPWHLQKCHIGIVASTKGRGLFGMSYDSCPRVIPEMLACGLPIVVLDELEFWADKYITPMTGRIANRYNFWDVVKDVLVNKDCYNPRKYYEENLTTKHAAKYLRGKIDDYSCHRLPTKRDNLSTTINPRTSRRC